MSAGNTILAAVAFAPATFPNTQTILSSGNYWIEEIDFILAYVNNSAASGGALVPTLQTSPGAIGIWQGYFYQNPTAAGAWPLDIVVTSRPRIFLPRTQSVTLTWVISGSITQIVYAINIYGRSLP